MTKEDDNEKLVNIMLERLSIEYFDVLLIHNINASSIKQAEDANSFEYIKKAKEEGKAIKVGISYHDKADLLDEILDKYSDILDIVQLQLNYLDWNNQRVQSKECHDVCVKYDKEITVMEPLKGGTLINLRDDIKDQIHEFDESKTPAYYGLKFAASQDNVSIVLSGMNKLSDMKNNCETFTNFRKLTDDENKLIDNITEKIINSVSINCSYCKYCVKECPMNIPIPDFFNLYNNEKMYHLTANHAL